MGVAIPLSVFHSMFAPVFGAIAHQFSDLRDPAGKDRLYGYRESNTLSFFFTNHNANKFSFFLVGGGVLFLRESEILKRDFLSNNFSHFLNFDGGLCGGWYIVYKWKRYYLVALIVIYVYMYKYTGYGNVKMWCLIYNLFKKKKIIPKTIWIQFLFYIFSYLNNELNKENERFSGFQLLYRCT